MTTDNGTGVSFELETVKHRGQRDRRDEAAAIMSQ